MVNEQVAGHVCTSHCSSFRFHHHAQNIFLIDQYFIWCLVAAAFVTGGIFFNTSHSGYQRAHIIAYSEFVIGLNGNGEEARGIKIGLQKDHGAVWISTVYPIEAGVGT